MEPEGPKPGRREDDPTTGPGETPTSAASPVPRDVRLGTHALPRRRPRRPRHPNTGEWCAARPDPPISPQNIRFGEQSFGPHGPQSPWTAGPGHRSLHRRPISRPTTECMRFPKQSTAVARWDLNNILYTDDVPLCRPFSGLTITYEYSIDGGSGAPRVQEVAGRPINTGTLYQLGRAKNICSRIGHHVQESCSDSCVMRDRQRLPDRPGRVTGRDPNRQMFKFKTFNCVTDCHGDAGVPP